jgi:hypothetical protein
LSSFAGIFRLNVVESPEAAKEIGASGGEEVIVPERAGVDGVERGEPRRRARRQSDRHGAVQLHHG